MDKQELSKGIVTVAEELRTPCWWSAGISSRCFSIRLNLLGLKNLLFGSSAAFAFGKAGEVLTVSFLHKLLFPFLEQSGPSTSLSPPRVCSCYGGMCVYVFFCLQQKCSTSTIELFAVSLNDILRKNGFVKQDMQMDFFLCCCLSLLDSSSLHLMNVSPSDRSFCSYFGLSIETWRVAGLQQQIGCA